MDSRKAVLVLAAAVVFITAVMPQTAGAVDLIVEQNPTDTSHFSDIQAAITNAVNILTTNTGTTVAYNILVEPGTYPGPITLQPNISVRGRETARTILTGGGSGPVVTANNVTGTVNFQNFTIVNASIGISVSNNSAVNITNNVFTVGTSGTAIQIQNSPSAAVINNTFFQNGIAVSRDTDAIKIINNIFSQNTTAISQAAIATVANVSNNAYFSNTADGPKDASSIPNATVTLLDPLFVEPSAATRDFHLKEGSPCINNGTSTLIDKFDNSQSDIGAYGGQGEDLVPFPVSNVAAVQTDASTITVTWNVNPAYLVSGYRVYYGKTSGNYTGTDAQDPSPIALPGPAETSLALTGISATVTTPAAPVLEPLKIQNSSLGISWSEVPGVTQYKVYYSKTPFDATTLLPDTFVVVDNATSYTLPGLRNGQSYFVAVSAIAQAGLFVAVTAYQVTNPSISLGSLVHGQVNESAYSQEAKVGIGGAAEGAISAVQHEFPDEFITNPNLVNRRQGCFIATAAYGHYTAPQVRALRDFRDQYLLTNRPGRAFVAWYYVNGPVAAEWLNAHPDYKPFVRAALLPAVGVSLFMTAAPIAIRIGLLMTVACIVSYAYYRRRSLRAGGPR